MWNQRRNKAAAQSNFMGNSPEDCEVCLNAFDNVQRPLSLPCGHTFCGLCLNTLTRSGYTTCPACGVQHVVPMGGQFPINFTLESVIRTQRNAQGAAGISSKTRSLLKDQETKIVAAISTCQNVHSQINQYERNLESWGSTQQMLQGKIQKLMDQNKTAKDLVQHEKFRTSVKREEVKQEEQDLRAALQALKTVTTEQEAGMAFLDATRCTEEAQEKAEECRGVLSDDSASVTREIMDASSGALNSVQSLEAVFDSVLNKAGSVEKPVQDHQGPTLLNQRGVRGGAAFGGRGIGGGAPFGGRGVRGGAPQINIQVSQPSAVPNILKGLHIRPQPAALKVADVYSLRQPTRGLLEAGRVFAIHQVQGQWQCASITLSGSSVCLHALQDQTLPAGAATLQMSEVLPFLPPCQVFLELTWPGSSPRQVRIRFSNDSPRARQFVLLCTGQWGPSYVGTKLFAVEDKGRPVERVKSGDYESNNGGGGAALLPNLNEGDYQTSVKAGSVWSCGGADPARGAQFAISTKERTDRCTWQGVFGEVVHGLDVIAAAAKHHNFRDVTIVDCGLVLKE